MCVVCSKHVESRHLHQNACVPLPSAVPVSQPRWLPVIRPPSGPCPAVRAGGLPAVSSAGQPLARQWVGSRWRGEKSAFKIPMRWSNR